MGANIPQATIDEITDQITAKIMLALKESVSQAVSQAVTSALADLPQPTPAAIPAVNPTVNSVVNSTPVPGPLFIPNLDLYAYWIWIEDWLREQPFGSSCIFRKSQYYSFGEFTDTMIIDIACNSYYTLYVNGYVVGNGSDWHVPKRYSIKFPKTNHITIAVYVANGADYQPYETDKLWKTGLVAYASTWDSTDLDSKARRIRTNETWGVSIAAAAKHHPFHETTYDPDRHRSIWNPVFVQGKFGRDTQQWLSFPGVKPTTTNFLNGAFSGVRGVADPPSAPLAMSGPNADDALIGETQIAQLDGADR